MPTPRSPALTKGHHGGQHEGVQGAGARRQLDRVLLRHGALRLLHQVVGDAEFRPVVGDDAALAGER